MSEEDYITVERYLSNDLSALEKEAFLGKVAENSSLAKYLSQAQEQEEYLNQVQKKQDILEQVTAVHKGYAIKQVAHLKDRNKAWLSRKNVLYFTAAAATVLLLVYAFATWNSRTQQTIIQHRPLASEMGRTGEGTAARRAFNQGEYEKALTLLENVIASSPEVNPDWLRALGICQIELKNYEEALSIFVKLATLSPNHKEACFFYKGLIMYKLGNNKEAEESLNEISADTYYKEAAKKILKKIKEKS